MLRSAASVTITPPQPPASLNEDVFQKLLEAAWVLQEAQDRKNSGQLPLQFTQKTNQNESQAELKHTESVIGKPALVLAAHPIAPPTLLGSISLGSDTFSEYGLEPPEPDSTIETVPEAAAEVAAMAQLEQTSAGVATVKPRRSPALRLRLSAKHVGALRMAAVMILVLGAYAVVRSLVRDARPHVAAVGNPANTSIEAAELQGRSGTMQPGAVVSPVNATVRTPDKARNLPPSVATSISLPENPVTSHKQVTDAATQNELVTLSRFEMRTLRRQAQYGDDAAALTLGMAYETGRYVRQNCKTAAEWVTRAAKDGNAAAEYNLGLRYEVGDGVPADPQLAEMWIQKSALRKYTKAQALLASSTSR
jgi:Sel1 repeat